MVRAKRATRRDAGRARGPTIAEAVLAATLDELALHGLEGLSVESVARRADVNRSTVYRRWPTREALVAAALGGVLEMVSARAPDTGSLRGDLAELLAPVAALAVDPRGRGLVRAALAESSSSSVAELASRALQTAAAGPMPAVIERARLRGEWSTTASPHTLMTALTGAILHRAMLERAPVTARWLDEVIDMMLVGVSPRR